MSAGSGRADDRHVVSKRFPSQGLYQEEEDGFVGTFSVVVSEVRTRVVAAEMGRSHRPSVSVCGSDSCGWERGRKGARSETAAFSDSGEVVTKFGIKKKKMRLLMLSCSLKNCHSCA